MNENQLTHFKNILTAWLASLTEDLERAKEEMQDDVSNPADPADRATQEEAFALELRARDRDRKLIRTITKTITLVDSEEYGYCEACGIEIGLQRLEVRPTAILCIDCKTTQEIKERQIA